MRLPVTIGRRLGAVAAAAGAATVLGAIPAAAAPPIPRGMPQVVTDVLGPQDPGFLDPAVGGTRVLTPVKPGEIIACATGFTPTISCSILNRADVGSPQRPMVPVDVPTVGGPVRVWINVLPENYGSIAKYLFSL